MDADPHSPKQTWNALGVPCMLLLCVFELELRIEDRLPNLGIVGRADAPRSGAGVVGQRGPHDIRIGGMNAALNMEPPSRAVTDRWIASAGGECLLDGGAESGFATCEGEGAAALGSVRTGGGGLGLGLGGTHEGGGGADVVFHNDVRLIPTLGYVNRFLQLFSHNDHVDTSPPLTP